MASSSTFNRAPVPDPVPSFWNVERSALDDYQSSPNLPPRADVLIIGSGLAGVGTAYHILQEKPDVQSIVLLEARQICSGATGRNGGHVKPDTYFNVPKYTKLYGPKAAAELAAFEASHVLAVKDLIERECLDCDFHLTRAVDVYLDPKHARETEQAYRELVKAGVVNLRDVAFTSNKDAQRVSCRALIRTLKTYILADQPSLTDLWGERSPMLLLVYCRTPVAIENGPPTSDEAPTQWPETLRQYACLVRLIQSR